ncbi:T9SS type A sorting domain-containing protein [Mariniflexile sp. HNIBRBA6329]|uniref:T9SS type A sorting domain-containing protein n=1 Tax=Mariniflexile sp. HNIBRBA6329 TaxID=3373088 RepID=UPI0037456D0B
MQKITLTILSFIMAISLNAQITLTSATSSPQIGDTFDYISIPNYTFDVSQSGANQTWDFSSATGSTAVTNYVDLTSALEPSTFPQANTVALTANPNAETYFSNSTSGQTIEGFYSPGLLREIYTDKREFIKYPITYNDIFNETFSGTSENIAAGQTYIRTGTTEISADGYGTLILPYTTVNNVLRIKITNTYSDTFMGFPIGPYNDVILVWYNATTKTAIASTSNSFYNGSLLSSYATYLDQSDLVLTTNNSEWDKNQVSVFPNPANDYVYIKNKTDKALPIEIYDAQCRIIKTLDIKKGENEINISSLNSGIYIIKFFYNSYFHTQKMVVK